MNTGREFFSTGSRGSKISVYRTTERERALYQGADLVRVENQTLRSHRELYFSFRIADALFPGVFIHVTAALANDNDIEIYSKMAEVPSQHAKFSAHMLFDSERDIQKESRCVCPDCMEHREYHKKHGLKDIALDLAKRMEGVGVHAPVGEDDDDPSDYCLGPQGLIFFEVSVDPWKVEFMLLKIDNPSEAETRALKYLELLVKYPDRILEQKRVKEGQRLAEEGKRLGII